jgi:hypothetical protein
VARAVLDAMGKREFYTWWNKKLDFFVFYPIA